MVAQMVKNLPAMWETWVQSLGWGDPLEKGMATHSSILAWRIPWTEEPGGLQSVGLQRVRHDWATNTPLYLNSPNMHRKLQWMLIKLIINQKYMVPKMASTKIFIATRGQIERDQNCFGRNSGRNVVLIMEISPGKCSSYYATEGESWSPSSSELTDHFNLLKTV